MNLQQLKHLQLKEQKILFVEKTSYRCYRRIMTGSTITKKPIEIASYTQCEFLDTWLLILHHTMRFRNRYAEMKTLHMQGRL